MAKTFNRMRIDVNESVNSIGIEPIQNDTRSRYLDVSLYSNGLPIDLTGEVVRINFKKEDGTTFFNQGEITNASEGRCQFALTNEILSDAKAVKAQISIWSGEGEILSTQVFTVYVSESIRNDEEVESTNEFGVLVVLFQEIQNALDTIGVTTDTGGSETEGSLMAKSNNIIHRLKNTEQLLGVYGTRNYKFATKYSSTPSSFSFEGKMKVKAIIFRNSSSLSASFGSNAEIIVDGVAKNAKALSINLLPKDTSVLLCLDLTGTWRSDVESIPITTIPCESEKPLETTAAVPYTFSCEEGFTINTGIQTALSILYCSVIYEE